MAHPIKYTRLFNFLRDANAGDESPAAAKLDAELNTIALALDQHLTRLKQITSADGRLVNVARAIAQSLVGTWEDTSDGTTTVLTDIPWDSDMSVDSVLVMVSSTMLRPSEITSVQDDGNGFLEITLVSAPTNGDPLTVWGFEPGAGLLTLLASTTVAEGASLIGIHDAGGLLAAEDVESALAELAGTVSSIQTLLGDVAEIFKRDGSVAATGDFDMAGFKITGAGDGVDDGDYMTVRQMATYIAAWNDLSRFFLKRDGTTAMAGDMNFGNNKGINLKDPDLEEPLDAVNVRTLLRTVAVSGAAPVGTVVDYIGETPPSSDWLLCDGQVYLASAYPVLAAILPTAYRTGTMHGCIRARFPAAVAGASPGDVSGGAFVTGDILSLFTNLGRGYASAPTVTVQNPDGTTPAGVVIVVTVSPTVVDGATVQSGGEIITAQITSGGSSVQEGAILIFSDTLEELPAGYFRTPDLRGRVTVGAGTESLTPGVVDPPDVTAGSYYNATERSIGDSGGVEMHKLTEDELAAHYHTWHSGNYGGNITSIASDENSRGTLSKTYNTDETGGDEAHQNMPPFHVLNKIIKAQ